MVNILDSIRKWLNKRPVRINKFELLSNQGRFHAYKISVYKREEVIVKKGLIESTFIQTMDNPEIVAKFRCGKDGEDCAMELVARLAASQRII